MRSETTNTTRSPQDLGQHIQVLTQVLQGIAGSIGMAPAFVDAPQFFYNYMYGDWHPYMEASEPATADLKARNQNVLHLVNYLESLCCQRKRTARWKSTLTPSTTAILQNWTTPTWSAFRLRSA